LQGLFRAQRKEYMNFILGGEYEGKNPHHFDGEIIMGSSVNHLSLEKQKVYAEQVSDQLERYSQWTKPRTPTELERDMREARAILCLNPLDQELLAFGKIEYYGVNETKQVLYEFGSWISFAGNGYGKQVLESGRDLSAERFPYARLIAIVRSVNLKAQNIITESGGVKVGYIGTEGKHVYDITRRQQPTEIIKMSQGGMWTSERNYRHVI
jgi:RimJ/RimL family protein N-acetyltransferase